MTGKRPQGAVLRRATGDDAAPLAALARRTFRDAFAEDNTPEDMEAYLDRAFSVDQIRRELADPGSYFLLAFVADGDGPAGYAKLRQGSSDSVRGPDPVELERIYVDADRIGSGVGAALMAASLDAAREAGHGTIWLGVWERNPRAIAFYRRWQFEVVGEHVFRLGSDEQRDLVMARPLAPESEQS